MGKINRPTLSGEHALALRRLLLLLAALMALAGSMLLTACAREDMGYPGAATQTGGDTGHTTEQTPSEEPTQSGALTVAICADYPPFAFMQGGEAVGLDIDLATYIGKRMGREVQLQDMEFDAALSAVAEGRADLAIAAMQHTASRAEDMDFSNEYYVPGRQCVIVLAEHAELITTGQALDGAAVACMNGDVAMALLAESVPGAELIRTEDEQMALNLLLADEVDAAAVSWIIGSILCAQNEQLYMTDINIGEARTEGLCVAVRKGDEALMKGVNSAIEDAIKLELIDRWMNTAIEKAAELR